MPKFIDMLTGKTEFPFFEFPYCRILPVSIHLPVAGFPGRGSTPLLIDKKANKIVNNESAEIIRMFNAAFQVGRSARVVSCWEGAPELKLPKPGSLLRTQSASQ